MTLLLVGFAVTLIVAPVVRSVMVSAGILDTPNTRSSHTQVTPRGGGLAVLAGVSVATVVAAVLGLAVPWAALAGSALLALLGLADDRASIPPIPRLAGQAIVGAAVGASVGGGREAILGALLLPLVVNVVNFMDGINGISALHAGLWGVTALAVGGWSGHSDLATIGALTAGAFLGFLPWNAPRATLFLGDSGSYLLGGLIGSGILIAFEQQRQAQSWVVAAPITLYLADTTIVLARRAWTHKPLLQAHREHVYQVLSNELRLSHTTTAVAVTAMAGAVVICWWRIPGWPAVVLTASVVLLYVTSPTWVARFGTTVTEVQS